MIPNYQEFSDFLTKNAEEVGKWPRWKLDLLGKQEEKPNLEVFSCPQCGKAIYGKFMFSFPISLPSEELCMCGQLKSKTIESTISYK